MKRNTQNRFLVQLAASSLFVTSITYAQQNWDGDEGGDSGNAYLNWGGNANWYGNTAPTWNYNGTFNINFNNSSDTTITNSSGWLQTEGIVVNSTYTMSGGSLTINDNGSSGFDIEFKVENNASGVLNLNSPISVGKNGSSYFEMNPVGGDIVMNDPVFNDNSVDYRVYGNGGNDLTLNTTLGVGGTAANVDFTVYQNSNVIINNSQSWAGATDIQAGMIQLGSSSGTVGASGSSAVNVGTSGTLDLNGFSTSIGSLAGSGSVLTGGGTLTAGGNNSSTTFSGVISETGGLTKTGTGTMTLTGTNTYSGTTTISNGVLQIGTGGTAGSLGSGDVAISSGANLTMNQSDAYTLANTISGAGSVTYAGTGSNATSSAPGDDTTSGGGTYTISGTNTYTGGTTIQDGTFLLETGSAFGTGTITMDWDVYDANITIASADGDALTIANDFNLYPTGGNDEFNRLELGQLSGGTGSLTLSGQINLGSNAGSSDNARIIETAGTQYITGDIIASGSSVYLVKQNIDLSNTPSTLVLSGDNQFDFLVVDAGTVELTGGSLSDVGGGTPADIRIGGGLSTTQNWDATLEISSTTTTTWANDIYVDGGNDTVSRTLDLSSTSDLSLTGDVILNHDLIISNTGGDDTISGVISGNSGDGIYLSGGSTLTLTGDNTYDGETVVSGSGTTLIVNGNQTAANGTLTMGSGTILSGTGTVGGDTTVQSGATMSVGSSPAAGTVGTMNFNDSGATADLNLASGSVFSWDLTSESTATGFDTVVGDGGTLTASGTFDIVIPSSWDFTSTFWDSNQTWTVFSGFSTTDGAWAFNVVDQSGNPVSVPSSEGQFYVDTNGTVTWTTFSPIPELSNILIGGLLGAGLLRRRRSH